MAFSLLPREQRFFPMLEEQARMAVVAATLFREMATSGQFPEESIRKMRDLEHEGDLLTHEVVDKLNRTFVTPIDREDIHVLTGRLDDVLDIIQGITVRIHLFDVTSGTPLFAQLAETLEQATQVVERAVAGLRDLKRARRILDYCIEINRLENTGDHILEQALADLFRTPRDPIHILKWKEIYEVTEEAIDKCEDIANILEAIVVKHA